MSYHCAFPIQRLTAMTAVTNTLLNALEVCDMLEIDGLHAFDFSLDEDDNLHIECMDGRALKRWKLVLKASPETSRRRWCRGVVSSVPIRGW